MNTYMSDEKRNSGSWFVNCILVTVVLLVVAAVLFPVFARHHDYCPKSTCQNNLKQLGVALTTYMNENNGMLPSSKLVSGSKTWNRADFLIFATKANQPSSLNSKRQSFSDVIYEYLKSKDALWCPKDPMNPEQGAEVKPKTHCSYWWRLAIDKAWYGVGCKKPCRREKDFAYPSDQVVLYEHRSFHTDCGGLENGAQINVVYLDSHVKNTILKNATSGDSVNCAANSDGEPMYFNYNYETGEGTENPETPAKYIDPAVYCDRL